MNNEDFYIIFFFASSSDNLFHLYQFANEEHSMKVNLFKATFIISARLLFDIKLNTKLAQFQISDHSNVLIIRHEC